MPFVSQRAIVLSLLGAAAFAGQWNLVFLAPVLPTVADDTGVSVGAAGQLVTVSGLVALVSLVLLGPLSDRYGRRPMLSLGLAAMALAALGSSFTDSYPLLMALRVLSGVADALVLPSAAAAVADYFHGKEREIALNILFIPIGAAAVIGLPVVVLISNAWDWQAAFLVFAVCNAVVLLGVRFVLPSARTAHDERTLREHYREAYAEVLKTQSILVLSAAVLGGTVGSGVFIYAGAFFEEELGVHGVGLSGLFAAFGAAYVLGGVAGAVLARRLPPRPIALASLLVAAVIVVPLVRSADVIAFTIILALVFSASRAPGIAALNNIMLDLMPGAQGTAVSAFGVVTAAGYFLGALTAGIAIDASGFTGMAVLFTVLAACALILLLLPVESETGRRLRQTSSAGR